MSKQVLPSEIVQFNGMSIICVVSSNETYITVKSVCSALGVDFSRQLRSLKKDPILGSAWSNQTTQVGDDQPREWVCIPERYVYGWLFSIQSKSEALLKYKKQCYDVLYNYFHGALSSRKAILRDRVQTDELIAAAEERLQENADFQLIQQLRKKKKSQSAELYHIDQKLVASQLTMFEEKPN